MCLIATRSVHFVFLSFVYSVAFALPTSPSGYRVAFQDDWFNLKLLNGSKQVAGLSAHPNEPWIAVFHRSSVVWDGTSFNEYNQYLKSSDGPIKEDSILIVSREDSKLIASLGRNIFYLPHGISYDFKGNIWTTDVALHQVLMLDPNSPQSVKLTLGSAFVPGNDIKHFCKPTDVKVSKSGLVYVSDGYCNSRIVVFTYDGSFVKNFGQQEDFLVAHSLALFEEEDEICLADRENGRIVCFNAGIKDLNRLGRKTFEFNPKLGSVYAIEKLDSDIIGVALAADRASAFIINKQTHKVTQTWNVKTDPFQMPHDLTVDLNRSCYISEISVKAKRKVFKFDLQPSFYISHSKSIQSVSTVESLLDTQTIKQSLDSRSMSKLPLHIKLFIISVSLFISCLFAWIYIHFKFSKRQKHDFSVAFKQLFFTPQDDGFDRLAMDEELNEHLMTSDSEVEEFNTKNYSKK